MEQKKTKLNLGCGITYKPDHFNIDKFNNFIADKICGVDDLLFKTNSIEIIEAHHLIEHFDYIHCKYVLSEWFRVLKPNGKLIIETPDLEKTFQKFRDSNSENKKIILQWIYGIDSLGMQHKIGFSWELIRELLSEIGFENILREKPKTYLYEPGMRIVAQKPENFLEKQLFACFRKKLKKELKTDDSYLLIPLENWVNQLFNIYSKEFKTNKNSCFKKIVSKISICNPIIPKIFWEECINYGFIKRDEINHNLMNYLVQIEFHKKSFSLWVKRKKTAKDSAGEAFKNFIEDLEFMIVQCLADKNLNYKEKLNYINSLDSADIKIFDFQIIQFEARKLFNQGVKEFYKKNYFEALNLFLKSVKINPNNPLNYWNMARLGIILNYKIEKIENDYKNTLSLISDKEIKNRIIIELNNILNKMSNLVPKIPIPEDY